MASDAAIFLVTTTGDTESSVPATDKIEFNTAAVPSPTDESFLERTSWHMAEDIAEQGKPTVDLNNIQPQKLGFLECQLTGFIDDPTNSQDLIDTFNMMKAAKRNSDFKKGRIGLRVNKIPFLTLTPSATIGYILTDFQGYLAGQESERYVAIILQLRRNGVI